MITYKTSNQHIKRSPCDQREYSTALFTGNLEEKNERKDSHHHRKRPFTHKPNVESGLLNGSSQRSVMGLMPHVGYIQKSIFTERFSETDFSEMSLE